MQDHSKLPLNKPSDIFRINRRKDKNFILILAVSASSIVTSQQNMPRVMRTQFFVKRKRKDKSTQPLGL